MPSILDKKYQLAATVLGFTSVITQVILVREFLNIITGNELVIGIILANWMLLTGAGAIIGRFAGKLINYDKLLIFLLTITALIPFLSVLTLRLMRNVIHEPGVLLSLPDAGIYSLVLLIPYCLISGVLFTLISSAMTDRTDNPARTVYFYDNIGSIAGGAVFSFILIFFLSTFQNLSILILVNLLTAYLLIFDNKSKTLKCLFPVLFLLFFLPYFFNIDAYTADKLYKGQDLVMQEETPYGNLTVTKTAEQFNFFENGVLLFSTGNIKQNEEAVHYAMIQHEEPERILLIHGGAGGQTKEISKYEPDLIDYVEINPEIIKLTEKYTDNLDVKNLSIILNDGRRYIKQSDKNYNVAIINAPSPSTAQLNRFYTVDFFNEVKNTMADSAILSINLPSSENYTGEEALQLISVIYNSLSSVFKDVLIIPAGKNYLLASDGKLSENYIARFSAAGIKNEYVNQYHIDPFSRQFRRDELMKSLRKNTELNRDFNPIAYFQQITYELSYFNIDYTIIFIIYLIPFIIFLVRLNPVSLGLFAGGFAGSASQLILLMSFQIMLGYIYYMVSVIITLFMLGLALGINGYTSIKINGKNLPDWLFEKADNPVLNLQIMLLFLVTLYSILLPLKLMFINDHLNTEFWVVSLISIYALVISFFVGLLFAAATNLKTLEINKIESKIKRAANIAGEYYGADLIGGALGAFLVSVFFIPIIGFFNTCLITAGLNILAALVLFLRRRTIV